MAERSVRVTHVVFDLNGGGFESLIAEMARREAGTSVTVSAITLSGRAGRVGTAITPLLDQYHVLEGTRVSMLRPVELADAIRATRANVVHLHSGCWYKGSLAARMAGAGVVYTEHGREHFDPLKMRLLDRVAAWRTDAVVTVSDRLGRYMQRVLGVRPSRLHTIQNGVDTAVFSPGAAPGALRARFGIPADAFIVGSIGRLETVKAYSRLIDAVAALRSTGVMGRPVYGIVWGDGGDRQALEAHVASRGLAGIFHLPGWTDDAVACHRLLDVFALTSISEGASVSLMESLASGVTPLVMNVGANAEVIGPELAAQVVPAGDVMAFTAALEATLADESRRRAAGEAGRRWVVERYSLDAMIAGYERLYRQFAR